MWVDKGTMCTSYEYKCDYFLGFEPPKFRFFPGSPKTPPKEEAGASLSIPTQTCECFQSNLLLFSFLFKFSRELCISAVGLC